MDKISVIVPVYNVEKYLRRCIDSILRQSYSDFELILIDDGSTDTSGNICDSYLYDSRVRVIHQKNQGSSVARNTGLDIFTGQWLVFIDSDDFVSDDYLEYMLGLCKKYNVKVAQCGVVRGTQNFFPEEDISKAKERKWDFFDLYSSSNREYRGVIWAKIYKAEVVKNYRFPVERKVSEDEDACFYFMYNTGSSVISNRHIYYYYMSENSLIRAKNVGVCFDVVDTYINRINFLQAKKEAELVNLSIKEFCIRLIALYCRGKQQKCQKKELVQVRKYFLEQFSHLNLCKLHAKKEILAIIFFRFFPNMFAFIDNKTNIRKYMKYRREKK